MSLQISVIYLDDDIVAINKPAGIPSQAAYPDPQPGDVVSLLKTQLGTTYLGEHQRLDKETTGVMVFARRPAANPGLAAALEGGQAQKEYLAIVHGRPQASRGILRAALAPDGHGHFRVSDRQRDPKAKPAVTRWQVETTSPDGLYSLMHLWPETGRTHQVRVHLAHLGCPVVGDDLYDPQHRPAPRLLLHARRLTLPHPTSGETRVLTAPPPALFRRVAEGLPELSLIPKQTPRAQKAAPNRSTLAQRASALDHLVELAVERRQPLADDPTTRAYRLIHAEGDGFPGMAVDWYDSVGIISLYEDWQPEFLNAFLAVLRTRSNLSSIYLKRRLLVAGKLDAVQSEQLAPAAPLFGPPVDELSVTEEGLRYIIRPSQGFSTGLFTDMREMRARVRRWAEGKTVLNCFAYTCAFGVAAWVGGATRVLNLDASQPALAWGKANYAANNLPVDAYDFVYGDVFDWLKRFARRSTQFDIVILDPPSYSTTRSSRFSAEHDYAQLVTLAAPVVAAGGLLIACTNHARLTRAAFQTQVEKGLASANHPGTQIGYYRAPAVDYPPPPGSESHLKLAVYRL